MATSNTTRLWVGGVGEDVTVPDLFDLFSKHGKVSSIVVRPNYAFVDIECDNGADPLIEELGGYQLHGSALTIEEAKSSQNTAISSPVSVFIAGVPKDTDPDVLKKTVASRTDHEIQDVALHTLEGNSQTAPDGPDSAAHENTTALAELVFKSEEVARECLDALKDANLPGESPKCFTGVRFHETQRSRKHRPDMPQPFPVQLLVRPSLVGAIIGRGGANIRQLAQASRARVELERREPHMPPSDRRVLIEGSVNNTVDAFRSLVRLMAENDHELNEEDMEDPLSMVTSVQVMIPGDMVGHLIGRSGASIKYITESSGAAVELIPLQFPANVPHFRIVKLEGTPRQLTRAFALMLRKFSNAVQKSMELMRNPPMMGMMQQQMPGMTPQYMPGFAGGVVPQPEEEMTVHVPAWSVGALIGRSGANIRHMMSESGADIRIHQVPEEAAEDDQQTRECIVRGTSERQLRAQSLIFRRLQEEQQRLSIEPSDPRAIEGFCVTFTIPALKVGRVIGRGGATIREIQKNSGVDVEVLQPEGPEGDGTVRVAGPFHPVQSALNMLRPIIHGK